MAKLQRRPHYLTQNRLLQMAALALIYLTLAALGLLFDFDPSNISPIWPASGVALAALLFLGYRLWPGIVAGAFVAYSFHLVDHGYGLPLAILISLALAGACALETLTVAFLIRRFLGAVNPLDQVKDVFKYLVLAVGASAIGATLGVSPVYFSGSFPEFSFGFLWVAWWLGATSSYVLITPLIISWVEDPKFSREPRRIAEAVISLLIIVVMIQTIFSLSQPGGGTSPVVSLLIFPFIFSFIWGALRFGSRGATLVVFISWLMIILNAAAGTGSLTATRSFNDAILILQVDMLVIAMLTMVPTAIIAERRTADLNLRKAKEDLEARSSELSYANTELQREIIERSRAEADLKQTLADLERSNAELQQFAHVASHDLQEPLRMVASYVQLLQKRYQGQLDDDADEFIAFAAEGANRMQAMINDLLQYSRVGSRGKPFLPTDVNLALEQALANLKFVIEDYHAQVTSESLPTLSADESQLVQLFQNLIGNAIKFCRQESPRVEVSARREGSEWIFAVKDNGIGIDPQYFQRIFIIFQRLHSRRDYSGTGIGLAICKRIIERHGGRIWVESEPGEGSTFFFTLPLKQEKISPLETAPIIDLGAGI